MYPIIKMFSRVCCEVPVHLATDKCLNGNEQFSDSDIEINFFLDQFDLEELHDFLSADRLGSVISSEETDSDYFNQETDNSDLVAGESHDDVNEVNEKIHMDGIISDGFKISSETESLEQNAVEKVVEKINRKIAMIRSNNSEDESIRNEKINGLEYIIREVQHKNIYNIVLNPIGIYQTSALKIIEYISSLDNQSDLDRFLDDLLNEI